MYGWQVGQGQAGCIGAGEGAVSDGDLERLYRDSVSVAGGAGLPDSYGYHNAAQYQVSYRAGWSRAWRALTFRSSSRGQQQYPQLQQQQQQQLYHSPVPPYPYPYPQPPTFAPAALPEIAAFPPQQQPQLDYSLQQLPTTYTTDMASFAEPQWSQPSSNWYPTAEPHPPPSTSLPSQHFPMPGYAPPTVPDHPYDYLQPLPLAPPLHPSQPAPRNPPAPRPPPAAPTPATSRRPTTLSPSPKISRPVNLKSLTTEEAEAVALAAAGRKGHLTEPTSPPSSSKRLGTLSGKGGRGGGSKKSLLELAPTCWECGIEVARLVLRGPDVERLVPRCRMACLSCAPAVVDRVGVEEGGEGEGEAIRARRSTSEQAEADEATYFDTLSAAVDMLEGVKLSDGVEQRSLLAHVDVPARDDGVKCEGCAPPSCSTLC